MKTTSFYYYLLSFGLLYSCNQSVEQENNQADSTIVEAKEVVDTNAMSSSDETKEMVASTPVKVRMPGKNWIVEENEYCSFSHAADWTVTLNENQMLVVVRGPQKADKDNIRDNVTLLDNDLSAEYYGLADFVRLSEYQIKHMTDKPQIIESKPISIEGREGHHMKFMADFDDQHYLYRQYYFVKERKAYIWTMTVELSASLEEQKIAEDVFMTFKPKF